MTIPDSLQRVGYEVHVTTRPAFDVVGYTQVLAGGEERRIPGFWSTLKSDGRLDALKRLAGNKGWLLGLGSWDPDCPQGGQRYTVCVEAAPSALQELPSHAEAFHKQIGASDWLRFQVASADYPQPFWTHNAYRMMQTLGYRFNTRDFTVGLHFDAYPIASGGEASKQMEFRISVESHSIDARVPTGPHVSV